MKIKFYYNINQDLKNWERQLIKNGFNYQEIQESLNLLRIKISNNKIPLSKIKILILNRLKEDRTLKKLIKEQINILNEHQITFKKATKIICKILNTKNCNDLFKVAITTHFNCPYDYQSNWFMVSCRANLPAQITNIIHEILHLIFIKNYRSYCLSKGLTENQFSQLTEALTVILNFPEFDNILSTFDKGYQNDSELRLKITKIINNNKKNFLTALNKIIIIIKK